MATTTTPTASNLAASGATGSESSLSSWAGPYVTEMLGKGQALANQPYQGYTGPLTAGPSALQQQAFQGIAGLTLPTADQTSYTPQTLTAQTAQTYMNPYLQAALQPQIDEARRQADIQQQQTRGQLTKAGAYGGGRQAIMESEANRALLQNLAGITGKGYADAYTQAMNQFNTEEARRQSAVQQAQQYGLAGLQKQAEFGGLQRDIEQQGITADIGQFQEERDYPYKQVQYMQSLLQGLPTTAQTINYPQPSVLQQILGGATTIQDLYNRIFGPPASTQPSGTTTTPS